MSHEATIVSPVARESSAIVPVPRCAVTVRVATNADAPNEESIVTASQSAKLSRVRAMPRRRSYPRRASATIFARTAAGSAGHRSAMT